MGKRLIVLSILLWIGSFTFFSSVEAAAANKIHTVSSKDTIQSIASKYKIPVQQLMKANGLPNTKLYTGQKLQILNKPYTSSQYQWQERGKQIANYAKTFVGFKKTIGEESPNKGFDSSGLLYWVLSQERLPIDRLTIDGFYNLGMDTNAPKPGDLLFFVKKDKSGKVKEIITGGIYLGNNQFVHSGIGASTVQIKTRNDKRFAQYSVVYKTYTPKGEHVVQKGETLQSVSAKYRISMAALKKQNGLPSNSVLPGQYLQVYSNPLFPFYLNADPSYDKAFNIIKYAYTLRGFSYVWGEENPAEGMDCSGFIYWVMKQQGFSVKRDTAAGYSELLSEIKEPKVGDLVFFTETGGRVGITHVGIYMGNDRFIHTTTKAGVHISLLSSEYFAEKFHSYGDAKALFH